jgi:hypothetical protein
MKLLPSNWYKFTISQARIENISGFENLILVYTINSGEFAYRNILKKYPINKYGLEILSHDMSDLKYTIFTNDIYSNFFLKQFVGMKGKMKVERSIRKDVVANEIIELRISTSKPEKDVLKESSEDHFYENNKGRKLPLK